MLNSKRRLYGFLFASSLGTFLEFFDIALYSFASALIAKHFFPANDAGVAVLATWGIFAISYMVRPLGAIWFGHLADVHSSKRAMVISMSMMAFATTAIGLLPTYAAIGIWAPIILLLLRMLQSLAVSPEYNLPSVFIKNNAWFTQRFGLVSSLTACVTGLGMMSASWIMSKILSNLSLANINAYQWRIPFIVAGILVGTLGIYLRWNLDESLIQKRPSTVPFKLVFNNQARDFIQGALVAGYVGCMSYTLFGFLIHQLQVIKHMHPGEALAVLSRGALLPTLFALVAGYLSDKYSRSLLMLIAAAFMGICGYYLFANLHLAAPRTLGLFVCWMLASLGFFAGSFPGYLAELFQQDYRYTGSFLAYNLGMSWIGGISPILFISLAKINFLFPPLIILGYSLIIVLLMSKRLVTFGWKSPKIA